MQNAIEIKGVTKRLGDFCIDNLSLSIPTGFVTGFIGENGAGKSTTIKLILDAMKKDAGDITVLGKPGSNLPPNLKEQIGVVFDECCFGEALSAGSVGKMMSSIYATWDKKAYASYIQQFGLPLKKRVKAFSRGMKMKLSLAVALSHNPKLLILDEATGGLDPVVRDEILEILSQFMQDETHSIFMSSHIVGDLEKICDYIAFIHHGKLVFCHSKDELMQKYAVLHCGKGELDTLPKNSVIGTREHSFGIEALVEKSTIPRGMAYDKAGIEDIMLYYIKGAAK